MRLRAAASPFSFVAILAGPLCWGNAGCSPPALVPLLSAAGIPITDTPPADIPLEVMTRGTGVRDPLPVAGSSVQYTDIENALGHAVSSATVPWADKHRAQRPEGWQLSVELTKADARYQGGRLMVELVARATLRTRSGHQYLAQSQAFCREASLVEADRGAPVLYGCMMRIGRDLAAWLGGIEP